MYDPRYESRTAVLQPISRSNVTFHCWMRGCCRSNGTQLPVANPLKAVGTPPVMGLNPCVNPGHGESGATVVGRLVIPTWNEFVANESRIPCAADVG